MKGSLLALALVVASCGSSTVDAPPLDGRSAGCGDAALYRVSADNGTVMSLHWPGAATGTWELNDTVKTIVSAIGTQGIQVRMEVGQNLGQLVCNDVVEKEPVVERVYTGISGAVELTLTVGDGADPSFPTATARITDLVLRAADGKEFAVDEVTFRPVTVGWFAG